MLKQPITVKRYGRKSERGWKRPLAALFLLVALVFGLYHVVTRINLNLSREVGEVVDSLNGVAVHHNGGIGNTSGRNQSSDGYNIGIRYQCVEFVKRYYYERLSHRMPDSYGHAMDFFEKDQGDGG